MREIDISTFRTQWEILLEDVHKSQQPVRITRRGKPLVEIIPPATVGERRNFLGSGADTFDILDNDIVGPIIDFS